LGIDHMFADYLNEASLNGGAFFMP